MHSFVKRLLEHDQLGRMVGHHQTIPGTSATYADPSTPLPVELASAFADRGIERLYSHQARALDITRENRDLLLVTPTASGKTLAFAATILESVLTDRRSRALMLYPTKALARDQIAGFSTLARSLSALDPPRIEIYDGDTPQARRRKIKADPPHLLITNPDMLHLGLLPHHPDWAAFFRHLRWVVLDELHVYRGVFGAHVHHILARLKRLCALYGASPRFVAASATIGNPAEFVRTLVGREFEVIETSGAPVSARELVFLNPAGISPYTAAMRVISEAMHAGHRTIAFTKARRITELLHTWLVRQEPALESKIAPYRAGYLPEERRAIEQRLFSGELLAVLSTSALELGIDVGGLDLCVLVGYPGSLMTSWQRIGRVGRQGKAGLVVMVAMPDALDQYVVHHPELFCSKLFESAVLDPTNAVVAGQHLVCAAAEAPLTASDVAALGDAGSDIVAGLCLDGRLVQDAGGDRWFSFKRRPQRDVSPRSAGRPYSIVEHGSGKLLGNIDGQRVFHECHPGAIYLHAGRTYLIRELDQDERRAIAEAVRSDYYTVVLGDKETEIIERLASKQIGQLPVGLGRLKVTVQIKEFQKKKLVDGEPIAAHPLDLPPLIYETIGFWFEIPGELGAVCAERELHFMGGLHATEHAAIGLFPLLAIADRDDVGGISYTGHPQTGGPAVFIFDSVPGGAGLAQRGFDDLEQHLRRTRELIGGCPCEVGCPACIQSPKCGNGNKPLDKQAALLILDVLLQTISLDSLGIEPPAIVPVDAALPPFRVVEDNTAPRRHGIRRAGNQPEPVQSRPALVEPSVEPPVAPQPTGEEGPGSGRVLVFDLETQRSAEEVGGWGHIDRMGLALGVVYDMRRQAYRTYYEADVEKLLLDLVLADLVVGFNIDRFDLRVLTAYSEWDLTRIRTLDMLSVIHKQLGFRLSLGHLSEVNMGESKGGDGLQSLAWWREGRIDLIEQYCRKDVEVTRKLFELGRHQGYLLYRDHSEREVRVPIDW